jgi:hypothetical protein
MSSRKYNRYIVNSSTGYEAGREKKIEEGTDIT